MSFLYPTYLWGLTTLAIPIAIHLWSKRDTKTRYIGSVNLLKESSAKKASSIHLHEYFLLFVRLLLLSVLIGILAQPQFKKADKKLDIAYLIEPGLLQNSKTKDIFDSIPGEKMFYLQKGFPEIDKEEPVIPSAIITPYWQLAQVTSSLNADSIVIFTKALQRNLLGKRPKIPQAVDWIILNPDEIKEKPVKAIRLKDSIRVYYATSNSQELNFTHRQFSKDNLPFTINTSGDSLIFDNGPALALTLQDTIKVQMHYDDFYYKEQVYLTAALRALSKYIKLPIAISDNKTYKSQDNPDLLIWLKKEKFTGKKNFRVLLFNPQKYTEDLIVSGSTANVFQLTESLNAENSTEKNLAEALLNIINPFNELSTASVDYDLRSVSQNILKTKHAEGQTAAVSNLATTSVEPWFWGAFMILLIVERFTAYYRKQ